MDPIRSAHSQLTIDRCGDVTHIRFRERALAAALVASLAFAPATRAVADTRTPSSSTVVADERFGKPPSGEIPILFDDRTVYAKPDLLKRGRVLAGLVSGGQIYVPLRSMFEQMGATVSQSGGLIVTAAKDGTTVTVTLGKNEVVINGEPRPLDVPPMVYKGVVLVPVRVISEALGAYVQWVPSKRVVVVRYFAIVPSPPPAPVAPPIAPAPVPAPILTAAPTVAPLKHAYGFIQGAFAAPRTYNEFSDGQYCSRSYVISAAYGFKDSPFAVKLDYHHDAYVTTSNLTDSIDNHYTRFSTIDGGSAFTPVFLGEQSTLSARLEYQIAAPHIYLGASYLHVANDYGYPSLNAAGFGLEKLPELHSGVDIFGSAFYYPSASGNYTVGGVTSPNAGRTYEQQYRILTFDVGLTLTLTHFPVYLYGGFDGDRYSEVRNAPIDQTHDGPYLGLGVKL
ncbi:MAG: copper amine oxidase N-terminal domain-containing protein [Candidatus Eremiobacteraeota bacterium]|nr:copper amine oxidase N-terminal domain-containing protein [Candidatus Eremiobacteraeota bacterium]